MNVINVVLSSLTLISITGCATCVPRAADLTNRTDVVQDQELLNLVQTNFDACVIGASIAFCESAERDLCALSEDMSNAVQQLCIALTDKGAELDGYLARYQTGEAQALTEVQALFAQFMKADVAPAIEKFFAAHQDNIDELEEGLCIDLSNSLSSIETLTVIPPDNSRRMQEVYDTLRSNKGLLLKAADDGFEWVPFAGDAWGFLKMAYDPRTKTRDARTEQIVTCLHSDFLSQVVAPLRKRIPDHLSVETICRKAFDTHAAVRIYKQSESTGAKNEN